MFAKFSRRLFIVREDYIIVPKDYVLGRRCYLIARGDYILVREAAGKSSARRLVLIIRRCQWTPEGEKRFIKLG